jgi:hypothetical protein
VRRETRGADAGAGRPPALLLLAGPGDYSTLEV